MAFTSTTLAAACTADATNLQVTANTGFAAGYYLRVNDEFMLVNKVDGTTISVQRGYHGTIGRAHGKLSIAVVGLASDFLPLTDYTSRIYTYGAAGAITPKPGIHRLAAASGAAMTLVAPTADQEGQILRIIATAAQAYTVTVPSTTHLNNVTNHVATFTGNIGDFIDLIAINGYWCVLGSKNITLSAS